MTEYQYEATINDLRNDLESTKSELEKLKAQALSSPEAYSSGYEDGRNKAKEEFRDIVHQAYFAGYRKGYEEALPKENTNANRWDIGSEEFEIDAQFEYERWRRRLENGYGNQE